MKALPLLLLVAACAAPGIACLDRMKDAADRGDWAALAATELPACTGPADAACAEAQALRARGCREQAGRVPAPQRRALLDCAVTSGEAALAAAGESPPARRAEWQQALAWSYFARRQEQPRGPALCADNEALARHAGDAPGFLAASARFNAAAEDCAPRASHCARLAEAARLLTPRPPGPEAASLAAAISLESRSRACP